MQTDDSEARSENSACVAAVLANESGDEGKGARELADREALLSGAAANSVPSGKHPHCGNRKV